LAASTPEAQPTLVYATILFWQPRELSFLGQCVESLLAQDLGPGVELRVLLVDNGCGATPSFPPDAPVALIRLPQNNGFAGGHNVGLRHALTQGADYVLLFNSDAMAQPGLVRELLAAARAWSSAAFLGPLIVRAAAPDRVESAGQSFNKWTARHRELGRGASVSSVRARPTAVDAVSGCALLVRSSTLDAVGVLDDDLFMYFEDMDWCLRARRRGFDVVIVPTSRVLHIGEGSTGGASPRSTFYSVRNHMVVAARQASPIRGWLVMLLAFGYHLAFMATSRKRRNRTHLSALIQGAWAAARGNFGPWRSSADRH
jgi:GT2 family glycosyltransferase